jgi:hypothetical protein
MSTELEHYIWPTGFSCTLITDKIIIPNQYSISIAIEPRAPAEIAMGFKRLRTLVDLCLQNSVFIYANNPIIETFKEMDTGLVQIPTEPYDYFVGSVLFRKFQSITSNYFEIGFMTIDSAVGDHVQYCIKDPEETGLDLSGDYWWNKDDLDTGAGSLISWEDLDLSSGSKFEPKIIKGGRSEDK